jgi:3-(3-hydroxy-phenyl)propionate hydroxylase/bifunctional hydroxylase/dehydrase
MRIAHLMRPARPLLLNLSADPALAHAANGWQDRVDVIDAQPVRQPAPAAALLIRPDGYVAWAQPLHRSEQPVPHGLHKALTTWFGAANPALRPAARLR